MDTIVVYRCVLTARRRVVGSSWYTSTGPAPISVYILIYIYSAPLHLGQDRTAPDGSTRVCLAAENSRVTKAGEVL